MAWIVYPLQYRQTPHYRLIKLHMERNMRDTLFNYSRHNLLSLFCFVVDRLYNNDTVSSQCPLLCQVRACCHTCNSIYPTEHVQYLQKARGFLASAFSFTNAISSRESSHNTYTTPESIAHHRQFRVISARQITCLVSPKEENRPGSINPRRVNQTLLSRC